LENRRGSFPCGIRIVANAASESGTIFRYFQP
jgi:hypothetical protein